MAIASCIHVQKGVMQMDQNEILYDIFLILQHHLQSLDNL
jgi:hypothetical protein